MNKILSKYTFMEQLKLREKELTYFLKERKRNLKKAPDGNLYIIDKGTYRQFYDRAFAEKRGTYIRKSDRNKLAALSMKKYDTAFVKAAEKELVIIKDFIYKYSDDISNMHLSYPPEISAIVKPVALSDEEYATLWQAVPYDPYSKYEMKEEHITVRGERVRSKSEELIANTLLRLNIPYRYEYPFKLSNGITCHPDFALLNVKTRSVVYYEHFGKMGDPGYVSDNIQKLNDYSKNGLILGKNLIATFENEAIPLNSKMVETVVRGALDL